MTDSEARKIADKFADIAVNQYHEFKEFLTLCHHSEKRNDLLNKTARFFFGELQYMYAHLIILNVSKLADPPETRGHKNLSVRGIHDYFRSGTTCYPTQEAEKLVAGIENRASAVSKWRSKLLAHYDQDAAIGAAQMPDKFVASDIQDLYGELGQYVELLYSSVFKEVWGGIETVSQYGAEDLIGALKEAKAMRVLKERDIYAYDELMRNSPFRGA